MSETNYAAVTERITAALEQGAVPWRRPWYNTALPVNAESKRTYRGANLFLLSLASYVDHRWVTFRQAKELGGSVRRGEKASLVTFWKRWDVPNQGQEERRSIPLLRTYYVFNVEQCDGLSLPQLEVPMALSPAQRSEAAEQLVKDMPDPPRIREGGQKAFYDPTRDAVQMPDLKRFSSVDAYYATLFHELGHATGHEQRLNRPGIAGKQIRFGSAPYSREELIAELTSAYCCASLGLDNSLVENSASYIEGWLKALRNDPKAIVIAAGHAQRAADHIRRVGAAVEEEAA